MKTPILRHCQRPDVRLVCLGLCAALLISPTDSIVARNAGSASHVRDIDFERDIWPIFEEHCLACHEDASAEGRLRLDGHNGLLQGGVSGPALAQDSSGRALLIRRLLGEGDEDRMPLDEPPLSEDQIGLIQQWVESGAEWPAGLGADIAWSTHWAYVAPERPTLPESSHSDWAVNPIDRFVAARLAEQNLHPGPASDRARLLRRLYLDLIGIPPTVEQLDAFLTDRRPDAYEHQVEALLASPQYGVRWARPWLDAARYADSNGYQADQYREVWSYRDWVINAMNDDMSFDRFTLEQLAGDLLPQATIDQKIATGFHRLTTCNVEAGVDPEENRINQIIDRVNTTGTVWLGTTLECVQCHNHKYDPFTQRDYYSMFAYFNNTPLEVQDTGNNIQFEFVGPKMPLPLSARQQREQEIKQATVDALQLRRQQRIREIDTELAHRESTLRQQLSAEPQWNVVAIEQFASSGGADHRLLDDGSILISGARPDNDTYTVVFTSPIETIRAIRLEALTHESLPGNGPGRHHPDRPNFVLHDLSVELQPADEPDHSRPVELHSAIADYSQAQFPVAGAIDDKSDTGWAIHGQFGQDHWATFLTEGPLTAANDDKLVFQLDQHHGGCRTLGRFRLSVCATESAGLNVPESIRTIVALPADQRTEQQQQALRKHFLDHDIQLTQLDEDIKTIKQEIATIESPSTLVMVEQSDQRTTRVFMRGDFLNPGEPVAARTPTALHSQSDRQRPDRAGLAEWLCDRQNPLTARVTVNRWWAELFGRGLVATSEDFGTQGDRPTHPQLLDWLAVEFMDSGWSMKHVHRLIVSSATYRQSSRQTKQLREVDPDNRWLARGPRFRLPAETIRDNALVISGRLSTRLGGPPIYPPQPKGIWRHVGRNAPVYDTSQGTNRYRRGLYVVWRRSAPYPSFVNFDAPDRAACVVQRNRTNTPLQALTLLNGPAYGELTDAFAQRLNAKTGEPGARIEYAFRSCVARRPTDDEARFLLGIFQQELQRGRASDDPRLREHAELAAWRFLAAVLLNLDETISKG